MRISAQERKQARREALAGLSLMIFLGAIMYFGSLLLFRDLPAYLGYDTQRLLSGWEVLGALVIAILIIVFLVYLSVICWLVFAKLFFTRAEVLRIACYGPTTRFDHWLIDLFFPKDGE